MLRNQELQRLPSLERTPASGREDLAIRKLQQCCVVFDLDTQYMRSMVVKEAALNEMCEYMLRYNGFLTEAVCSGIVHMFSCNAFSKLPLDPRRAAIEDDPRGAAIEDDPHIILVYSFFVRFLDSPDFTPKIAQSYIDQNFVQRLVALFDCNNLKERHYVKHILHRVYLKLLGMRKYIRKQIGAVFYIFIYETERHNGILQLLELVASMIDGFVLPIAEEHIKFLLTILMSLHKVKSLEDYQGKLMLCIFNYLEKDPGLTESVVNSLLKVWPKLNSEKEVLFLKELEVMIQKIDPAEFPKVMRPVFQQLAKCALSPQHEVAACALSYFDNKNVISLVNEYLTVLLPIMLPSLYRKFHWHRRVVGLTYNANKKLMQMNHRLYDECVQNYERNLHSQEAKGKEREEAWAKIEALASQNIQRMAESAAANLPTPVDGESSEEEMENLTKNMEKLAIRKHVWTG